MRRHDIVYWTPTSWRFFRTDFLLCCNTVCRRALAFLHTAVRTDSTSRSIKHSNVFSLFPRRLKLFTSSANPPQMATQAAANKRQGPGLQCFYWSRTSQFDLNGQGRALRLDPPYTLLFYPADLCMYVSSSHFLPGIFSYFSYYFSLLLFCGPPDQNKPDPTQFPRTGRWICS